VLEIEGWLKPSFNEDLYGIRTPLGLWFFNQPSSHQTGFWYRPIVWQLPQSYCRWKYHPETDKTWLGNLGKPEGDLMLPLNDVPRGQPKNMVPRYVPHPELTEGVAKCAKFVKDDASRLWLEVAASQASWQLSQIGEFERGKLGLSCELEVGDSRVSARVLRALPDNVWSLGSNLPGSAAAAVSAAAAAGAAVAAAAAAVR